MVKRNVRLPLFEVLDQPDTVNSCAVRPVSTFAPQALILMNGPFTREQSKAMAVDLARTAGRDTDQQIAVLFRRTLGRLPTAQELDTARSFLKQQGADIRDRLLARHDVGLPRDLPIGADLAVVRALADLCLAMFNLNEFVYVD
jgi:hypothetical protein